MFLRGWDITNQLIFQSKIIKNHACNPNMLFDTQNHRKYQKVTQNCLQLGTQNPSKIIKNPFWHLPGSSWMHLCPTWSPKWSPRTFKWNQNGLLGTQRGHKNQQNPIIKYHNKQIYIFIFINWFQPCKLVFYSWESFQSASQQPTGRQKGPAAGAKP